MFGFQYATETLDADVFVSSGLSEHLGLNFVCLYFPAAVQRAEEANG
jgi:hypothetical protein